MGSRRSSYAWNIGTLERLNHGTSLLRQRVFDKLEDGCHVLVLGFARSKYFFLRPNGYRESTSSFGISMRRELCASGRPYFCKCQSALRVRETS